MTTLKKGFNSFFLNILELAICLVKYLHLLHENKDLDVYTELSTLPHCDKWIISGKKINFVQQESLSESDDDQMDLDVPSTSVVVNSQPLNEDEPGWTVVKTKRKI